MTSKKSTKEMDVVIKALEGGDTSAARRYLEQAIDSDEKRSAAFLEIGRTFEGRGEHKIAMRCYHEADTYAPGSPLAAGHIGCLLLNMGQDEEAKTFFGRVVKQHPEEAAALYYLGMACHNTGDVEFARAHFEKAIELIPDYADAYYGLGMAFESQHDLLNSVRCFEKYLKLVPGSFSALCHLIIAYREQGDSRAVKQLVEQAEANDERDFDKLLKFRQRFGTPVITFVDGSLCIDLKGEHDTASMRRSLRDMKNSAN